MEREDRKRRRKGVEKSFGETRSLSRRSMTWSQFWKRMKSTRIDYLWMIECKASTAEYSVCPSFSFAFGVRQVGPLPLNVPTFRKKSPQLLRTDFSEDRRGPKQLETPVLVFFDLRSRFLLLFESCSWRRKSSSLLIINNLSARWWVVTYQCLLIGCLLTDHLYFTFASVHRRRVFHRRWFLWFRRLSSKEA